MEIGNRVALLGVCASAVLLGQAGEARAGYFENCNGIFLEAEVAASCEVVPTEECEVRCAPVAMERVCASRLTTACEGGCTASAAVECRSGCETTCVPDCTAQQATELPPNCMGLCMSDCQQDCNVTCVGGRCRSQCAQICSSDCRAQCDAAPAAVCEPLCTTACWGSCEGRANVDCQVSCQSETFDSCETEVSVECTENCRTTGAAIFCDGQFLASAADLEACASDLETEFSITLDITIDVDIEASGWVSCAIGSSSDGPGSDVGLMALLGMGACWRIRRQVKRRTERAARRPRTL